MKVLFVCMGNICRSPVAAGVARQQFQDAGLGHVTVDSAGTLDFHAGHPADPRAIAVAAEYGLDLSAHRARQVKSDDFSGFDLILAMDRRNIADLRAVAAPSAWGRIRLLRSFAEKLPEEVPDPYYGKRQDFVLSHELISEAMAGLTRNLIRLHNQGQPIAE